MALDGKGMVVHRDEEAIGRVIERIDPMVLVKGTNLCHVLGGDVDLVRQRQTVGGQRSHLQLQFKHAAGKGGGGGGDYIL